MLEKITMTRAGSASPMRPITCRIRAAGSLAPVASVAINPSRYIQEEIRKYPHQVFQKAGADFLAKRA